MSVVIYGDPGTGRDGLSQIAEPVASTFPLNDSATQWGLKSLVQSMVNLLKVANGGGLAGPQVWVDINKSNANAQSLMLRLFIAPLGNGQYQEFINPVVTFPAVNGPNGFIPQTLQPAGNDGCLSVPAVFNPTPGGPTINLGRGTWRPSVVTIEYSTLSNLNTRITQTFTYNNIPPTPAIPTFVQSTNPDMWWVVQHEIDHLNGKLYYNYCDANDPIFVKQYLVQISAGNFPYPGYPTIPVVQGPGH